VSEAGLVEVKGSEMKVEGGVCVVRWRMENRDWG
jgi:hypothetical protein